MYQTILVPTDGSPHSVRAAEHGAALAAAFDASVHLVSVVDVKTAAGMFDAGGVGEEFIERLERDGEEAIETVESELAVEPARTEILRGDPSETIIEYAADHGADFLAMGTHGRTGLERYIAGSVAERVVRQADAPVLTVRATEQSQADGYDDVLLPTDGSEPAAAAVDHGLAIAAAVDATVHAVNVVETAGLTMSGELPPPSGLLEALQEKGESLTDVIASRAREAGIAAETEVLTGRPARDLLEYAEESGIDMVVMGTAGRTGASRYLFGSTAERVVRHADVPVVAVNAREEAQTE
jgi:nucleotide-binding universal stress UspA family protein